jgi:Ca-activated chloride channel family protein
MIMKIGALAITVVLAAVMTAPAATQDSPVSVEIVRPGEGERLVPESEIELEIFLAAGEQLAGVEVFLDDVSLGSLAAPPFIFPVKQVQPASVHRIRAVARTATGKQAVDTLTLRSDGGTGFTVRVDLITLYASVTDAQGNYVRGLKQEDFILEEEGQPQEIAFFSSEATPLTAALLMDVSSSMIGERIVRAQQAASDLVRTLITKEDRAMVLGFDHRLLMYQPLTGDVDSIVRAIEMTGPNGGTALYDAVAGTARKLFNLKGKRVIIVLSDGDDTDSSFSYDEVLDYLQKTSVMVYSVGLQTLTVAQTQRHETQSTMRLLRTLAEISGGQAYFPSYISHLPGIYAAIGRDLRSQYTIAYYPTNRVRDGKWRNIALRVRNRSDLVIRHRKGYYATP